MRREAIRLNFPFFNHNANVRFFSYLLKSKFYKRPYSAKYSEWDQATRQVLDYAISNFYPHDYIDEKWYVLSLIKQVFQSF